MTKSTSRRETAFVRGRDSLLHWHSPRPPPAGGLAAAVLPVAAMGSAAAGEMPSCSSSGGNSTRQGLCSAPCVTPSEALGSLQRSDYCRSAAVRLPALPSPHPHECTMTTATVRRVIPFSARRAEAATQREDRGLHKEAGQFAFEGSR
jgi:hypothetical protein